MADAHRPGGEASVYFNGNYVSPAEARLAADDHGLLYGLGFFDAPAENLTSEDVMKRD